MWRFVSDPLNDPRWCHKVKSVEPLGERRWRVVHKPVPLRPPMELALEHLDARPPEELVLREEDDASVFDVEYRLEPAGEGTRFTQVSSFTWKKLPRPLHRLFARGVRSDMRQQVRALRRVLEG